MLFNPIANYKLLGTSGLQQYPMYVVIIGKSFDFIPNGETQLAPVVLQQRLRQIPVRDLPTNNIPAVMAAAAGYILCTVCRDESGNPTPPPDRWIDLVRPTILFRPVRFVQQPLGWL